MAEQALDLSGGLPDCRSREQRGQIRTPFGLASPVYCASCGRMNGYTFADTAHLFYLCNDCDEYGAGLDLPVVDPGTVAAVKGGG